MAGLAYELSKLRTPLECLGERELRAIVRFANACGGLAATRVGAMSALPTRAAVDKLLETTDQRNHQALLECGAEERP